MLLLSLLVAVTIELITQSNYFLGNVISLTIITLTGLTFSYTAVSWYFSQRLYLRQQLIDKDTGKDPIFAPFTSF